MCDTVGIMKTSEDNTAAHESDPDVITKSKRVLTEKQREAFAKCVETRKKKYEERKDEKVEQDVNTKLKKLEEKADKLKSKIPKRPDPVPEPEHDDEEEPEIIVIRKPRPKKKVIVVEESESDEEQVIQRVKSVKPKRQPVVKAATTSEQGTNNIYFC